jgi:DNA repair photolyase
MRWDHLKRDPDAETATLPGMTDPAVVRRFDAPEALDTRFYEIEAKTVLNRVPSRSNMPFGWTVNPYRGCSHACTYCLAPETPVLLADGTTRPIGELQPGEAIYGTRRDGTYRRYVETTVKDRWATQKPAFTVLLEDGTELVASGDHRFLTARGWKHVTDAPEPGAQRPHLTVGMRLLGPGGFVERPEHDHDYTVGYCCGVVRGDGHVGTTEYDRTTTGGRVVHRFRLALADHEALERTRSFLARLAVPTDEFAFTAATSVRRPADAIRTSKGGAVERIRQIIAWPDAPTASWQRGFLAGIFDAAGSCDGTVVRISNPDDGILRQVASAARVLGFDVVREPAAPNGAATIRLLGGLSERTRFFLTVDPAITRKRSFLGKAVKSAAPLRVVSIEPAGTIDLVDITTGTGDFVAAGVISHNCFARPTHEYLNFNPGRDFEREIVVKVNAPERLRADLAKRARTAAWGDTVALGTNTDPYQWVESKYRLLPGIWEALRDERVPASVLTKSPLLLRDQKLMLEIQAAAGFEAALSIPSLDEQAWRSTEPHTPHPRTRIAAVAELTRIGIPTAVLVAPLMPGINDAPEQVEKLLAACTEAGAISVRGLGLHLRGSTRDVFLEWLGDARPDLVPLYEELYRHGPHLPRKEAHRLTQLVQQGERWGERVVRSDRARRATDPGASAPPAGRFDPLPLVPAAVRPGARAQVSRQPAPRRPSPATPAGGATQDVIAVGPPAPAGRSGAGRAASGGRPRAVAAPRQAPAPPEDQLSLF